MQRHIVVTGIPASGKSTIGHALAAALRLPMLDKDNILESLFNSEGIGNAEWRKRLSRKADELLEQRALLTGSSVLTSWWRHPASLLETGTPVEWLASLPGVVLEVYCCCSPQVATERFLSRQRHKGHLDRLKTHAELLASFQQSADFGPLGVGPIIEVNTERNVDLSSLLAEIELALTTQDGESCCT
jgi:hypothetical protein